MNPQRSDALDGMRGLAAQAVFISHLVNYFLPALPLGFNAWLSVIAQLAVVVFFVLSGFVIAGSIRARSVTGSFDLTGFALSRIARIYPPYLLAVLLCFWIGGQVTAGLIPPPAPLQGWPVDLSLAALARALTFAYTQGDLMTRLDGPLWSLRLEVLLYVVAACAAIALTWRGWFWRSAATLLAVLLLAGALRTLTGTVLAIATFGLGAAANIWGDRVRALISAVTAERAALAALGLALPVLGWPGVVPYASPAGVTIQIVIAGTVAMWVAHLSTGVCRLNAALGRAKPLGGFAYTLYVIHMPLIYVIALFVGGFAAVAVAFFAVQVFAFLAAQRVEKHATVLRWLTALVPARFKS
jgi:peptidoglycan/LPS O-acetylase OafA/YrhL